jgi:hypothetical protein
LAEKLKQELQARAQAEKKKDACGRPTHRPVRLGVRSDDSIDVCKVARAARRAALGAGVRSCSPATASPGRRKGGADGLAVGHGNDGVAARVPGTGGVRVRF